MRAAWSILCVLWTATAAACSRNATWTAHVGPGGAYSVEFPLAAACAPASAGERCRVSKGNLQYEARLLPRPAEATCGGAALASLALGDLLACLAREDGLSVVTTEDGTLGERPARIQQAEGGGVFAETRAVDMGSSGVLLVTLSQSGEAPAKAAAAFAKRRNANERFFAAVKVLSAAAGPSAPAADAGEEPPDEKQGGHLGLQARLRSAFGARRAENDGTRVTLTMCDEPAFCDRFYGGFAKGAGGLICHKLGKGKMLIATAETCQPAPEPGCVTAVLSATCEMP